MNWKATLSSWLTVGALLTGCDENAREKPADARAPTADASSNTGPRYAVDPEARCKGLFGRPNQASGLDDKACTPVCTCGDETWSPPEYSKDFTRDLRAFELGKPFDPVTNDPYAAGDPEPEKAGIVCGVSAEAGAGRRYRLVDYASSDEARRAGAFITHTGACGVCSTLPDLAVYIDHEDLTEPVRQCGLDHLGGSMDAHVACLQKLGFTLPCAQIWYFNTLNTRTECGGLCFSELGAAYHKPDGSLNPCLQCDEEKSGPVFKAVAGRTRRNSGLANALCRPCAEVSRVEHRYE